MAYTSGGTIQAQDYNWLAWGGNVTGTYTTSINNLAVVWGVGTGSYGYGQSVTGIDALSAGATVTATQWAGLVYTLNKTLGHQGGSAAQLATGSNIGIVAGATITSFANVSSSITTIVTNRANFNSTRGTTTTGTNLDGSWSSATPTTFQQVRTITFDDADKMRYFFNSGGRINLILTTVSGTDTLKETSWTNLLNTGFGTLSLDYTTSARSGTGYTLTTDGSATGFWDLTGVDATLIRLTDTVVAYNTNYVEVLAKVTGVAGSNGGKGTVITLTINYNDQAADSTGTGQFNDGITMTMRTRVDILRPETTYLSDVWGTITVAATVN